jgi:hypothetical protein
VEAVSNLLASGYTSTLLGIAGFSLLAGVSLLMTVKALSDLEQGGLPGADVATSMRALKF